jgi:adenylate cyclase
VLSGSVTKDKVVKLFDAGATDYISKPFIAEEFQARMASHLQNRMLSKQLQQYNLNLESRVEEATTEIRTLADDLRSALDQERRLSIEKEKMGRFLPRHVVDEIHRNRERTLALGGKTIMATVLFSDICGFTRLAEGMDPTELVGFLNQYMTAMAKEIDADGGIIDKFVGDGIMAVFGDQSHDDPGGLRGVRAAVRMQFALDRLRKKWTNTRPRLSDVRMRSGVNTGTVVAGNVGADTRMDYTVIGDTVNVASRLESECAPGGVLISEACFEAAQRNIPVQSTDAIHVKNRQ